MATAKSDTFVATIPPQPATNAPDKGSFNPLTNNHTEKLAQFAEAKVDPDAVTTKATMNGKATSSTDPGPKPINMNKPTKFKIGGHVQINGKWYKINSIDSTVSSISLVTEPPLWNWLPMSIFGPTNYRPPEPEPEAHEWIPAHMGIASALNGALTEHYGDPTERTYNGEPPEQFGLQGHEHVMWKHPKVIHQWRVCMFSSLSHGNLWRKLPKVLTQEGGAE